MDRTEFERLVHEQGYSAPKVKEYAPHADSEMHTHDVSCLLVVLDGEFILATDEGATSFARGEVCRLQAGTRHAERTGADGASILLSTK